MALSQKAREILNREDLLEKRTLWFDRMQDVFDGRRTVWNERHVMAVNGIRAAGIHDPYTEPERWMEDCLEDLAARCDALENETWFRPLCVEYGPYGVHYIDKILGARVFTNGKQWYNEYLTTPIGSLEFPDLQHNPVWQDTLRAMRAFVDAGVTVPLFGLPTIASTLNIAVNLYGENILTEMLLEPENAVRDLKTINDLLCELHRQARSLIPQEQLQPVISWNRTQPPGYGQLCGCTTQLISGNCYAEMIAPLDDELLSVYPNGGMIHLCGRHTQHMEAFRNMRHLKALQLNDRAAEDLALYHQQLRSDQVLYLNPCAAMPIEKAVALTKGERLIIARDLEASVYKP